MADALFDVQIDVNGIDHQVVVVSLDQQTFIVDVGYGAQVLPNSIISLLLQKLFDMEV